MKKLLLTVIIMAVLRPLSFAQWTTSGSNIYNSNTGNVGIGTSSPTSYLHIYGSGNTSNLNLQNTASNFYTQMAFTGTGRTYTMGVGNASETSFGVANSWYVYDGGSNAMRFVINASGNVGIGTTAPGAMLDVNGMSVFGNGGGRTTVNNDGLGFNRNASNGAIYNPNEFAYQLGKYGQSTSAASDILAWSVWSPTGGYINNTVLSMNGQGHVGVESDAPFSMFQVDDGVSKASVGSAGDVGSSTLGNGTSYLGFNAARYYSGTGSTQSWLSNTDGYNNGGGVIYGTVNGNIHFAPIASTGNSTLTLGDADIASKVVMEITPAAVYAKQVYVQTSSFPDYVFKKNYHLKPLADLKTYIDQNHHLPEIPTEKEVVKTGIDVGEMNKLLTKKVEELTLYLIEQHIKGKELEKRLKVLERRYRSKNIAANKSR